VASAVNGERTPFPMRPTIPKKTAVTQLITVGRQTVPATKKGPFLHVKPGPVQVPTPEYPAVTRWRSDSSDSHKSGARPVHTIADGLACRNHTPLDCSPRMMGGNDFGRPLSPKKSASQPRPVSPSCLSCIRAIEDEFVRKVSLSSSPPPPARCHSADILTSHPPLKLTENPIDPDSLHKGHGSSKAFPDLDPESVRHLHQVIQWHKTEQQQLLASLTVKFEQQFKQLEDNLSCTVSNLRDLQGSVSEIRGNCAMIESKHLDVVKLLDMCQKTQREVAQLTDELAAEKRERNKLFNEILALKSTFSSPRTRTPSVRTRSAPSTPKGKSPQATRSYRWCVQAETSEAALAQAAQACAAAQSCMDLREDIRTAGLQAEICSPGRPASSAINFAEGTLGGAATPNKIAIGEVTMKPFPEFSSIRPKGSTLVEFQINPVEKVQRVGGKQIDQQPSQLTNHPFNGVRLPVEQGASVNDPNPARK